MKNICYTVPYSGSTPVAVWYLNSMGVLEKLDCSYDPMTKTVTFTTNHLSLYVVGQDTDASVFNDVRTDHWFYNDVLYVFGNGLMNGTGENMFSPNATLTRAMVVTVLYRMEGEPAVADLANPFADAADGTWYLDAVKWAAANGIVLGDGDDTFSPERNITREQMAAILARYMAYIEFEPSVTQEYRVFADEDQISDYAKEAIQVLNKLDIMRGAGDDTVSPQGNATRAEYAAMLHRLLELIK